MRIVEAREQDMPTVRELFLEYQKLLGVCSCFHDFEQELATLPGVYAPVRGAIYLAFENDEVVGCVGMCPRQENEAELKRLYVQQMHQGHGIGKQLFQKVMSKAKEIGYSSMVLETLPNMITAKSLYLAYGFEKIPSYYETPKDGVECYRYMFK